MEIEIIGRAEITQGKGPEKVKILKITGDKGETVELEIPEKILYDESLSFLTKETVRFIITDKLNESKWPLLMTAFIYSSTQDSESGKTMLKASIGGLQLLASLPFEISLNKSLTKVYIGVSPA